MKQNMNRRTFVKQSVMLSSSFYLTPGIWFSGNTEQSDPVLLDWLKDGKSNQTNGVTWGVPWPRGRVKKSTDFCIKDALGKKIPVQSWPLGYWPDGTLKWTAHAIGAGGKIEGMKLVAGEKPLKDSSLKVNENSEYISVNTGPVSWKINKRGNVLIPSVWRNGREMLQKGRLVVLRQNGDDERAGNVITDKFEGEIERVIVEQQGPVRAVIKLEGMHAAPGKNGWLPFVVRLYFYANSDALRIMHTIIYDGDENKDFIKGLGFTFSVPMKDALHDRHIRFAGEEDGVFGEAVRGLTGLRRDPGAEVREAQLSGKKTPDLSEFPENVASRLDYIPAFGDYTLSQTHPDAFEIRKRTKAGHGWLKSGFGRRAPGMGYLGGPSGGVAFGIRNFWQSYPAQLDIRNAHADNGEVTLWLWAPDAPAMDLRFYHDGMEQDTYAKQLEGLEITYEDYEPGFGTPKGIARTSEMNLWILPETPEREKISEMADLVQFPPMVMTSSEHLQKTGVFGKTWSLPDRSTPLKRKIEDNLDRYFEIYKSQVDQHRWYGFWDYGDFMHSYDTDRHVWRYDVGGFAWDNSELSTDIWLWLYFLRTGKADVFRMAEAMTRHTGEVDVHHLGAYAPLGSRHNVQHWGCSAKQLRISTVANRRYYYYLTADERVGDLVDEQIDAVKTLVKIQPTRKVADKKVWESHDPAKAHVGFGTDWGAIAAAWLTAWERTSDKKIKNKLLNSMKTIAAQPKGFFSAGSKMDLATGEFEQVPHDRASASHLSAVFGLAEVCMELVELVDMPAFEKAWLQYCELYNAGEEAQKEALGNDLGRRNLGQAHSRLTAFAAFRKKDEKLAKRAWDEFLSGRAGYKLKEPGVQVIDGHEVLRPVEEAFVSTNATAQWGLAAIQCMALVGESLKK
ncbi:exo-rhamnogalacturonan lyase family protein [Sinomicrobium sp. M5D2P9]